MASLSELRQRRLRELRLTPDRALQTLEEAAAFLAERGMLTLTQDSALPSLFAACHEEPYKKGAKGFGSWPKTKYPWAFQLAVRTAVLAHEDEVAKWFSWPIEKAVLGELVRAGRLARAGPGWLAAP